MTETELLEKEVFLRNLSKADPLYSRILEVMSSKGRNYQEITVGTIRNGLAKLGMPKSDTQTTYNFFLELEKNCFGKFTHFKARSKSFFVFSGFNNLNVAKCALGLVSLEEYTDLPRRGDTKKERGVAEILNASDMDKLLLVEELLEVSRDTILITKVDIIRLREAFRRVICK